MVFVQGHRRSESLVDGRDGSHLYATESISDAQSANWWPTACGPLIGDMAAICDAW